MSDQHRGKKMAEEMEFEFFQSSYEYVTGDRLSIVKDGERPDFICHRTNNTQIGVEFTKIVRSPEKTLWDEVLDRSYYQSGDEVFFAIQEAIVKKSQKMQKGLWRLAENTMLVLQVMDCPLSDTVLHFDKSLQSEMAASGFSEIWVADYSIIEAFNDVDLFGIHPSKYWGIHRGPRPHGHKPYG